MLATGVTAVLDFLGRHDEALEVLEFARQFDGLPSSPTLYGGTAGRALYLLHFARVSADDSLREAAFRAGGGVGGTGGRSREWPSGYGLLRGPSGLALLFLHLHAETGVSRYLDLAYSALP
jgi:lantibiotic modifying enzyme